MSDMRQAATRQIPETVHEKALDRKLCLPFWSSPFHSHPPTSQQPNFTVIPATRTTDLLHTNEQCPSCSSCTLPYKCSRKGGWMAVYVSTFVPRANTIKSCECRGGQFHSIQLIGLLFWIKHVGFVGTANRLNELVPCCKDPFKGSEVLLQRANLCYILTVCNCMEDNMLLHRI